MDTDSRTLSDAMRGADVFYGLSVANVMTPEMVKSMAKDPIIFAMANPDPEINPDLAKEARKDVIIATGRSDYTNQINNVLGFPFIFRGALDVRAKAINDDMKFAASKALAALDQGGCTRFGHPCLWRREHQVRTRLHHPEAARSTRAVVGSAGCGRDGDEDRGGAQDHRYR